VSLLLLFTSCAPLVAANGGERTAFEMGTIEAADLRKRIESIDAQRGAIQLQLNAAEPPEIDESVAVDLAYAFSRWGQLGRARRRRMLESFGIRFWVEKKGRGRGATVLIPRIEIGSLNSAAIYN
jgi:hypothetical protein